MVTMSDSGCVVASFRCSNGGLEQQVTPGRHLWGGYQPAVAVVSLQGPVSNGVGAGMS